MPPANSDRCPVCRATSEFYKAIETYRYFECTNCGIIHLEVEKLKQIDNGEPVRKYSESYWKLEIDAALERARGAAILRMAEAIFLCQRPVHNAIDIGTGTGVILDELARYLPNKSSSVFGCELFPPPLADRTTSPNYVIGSIKDTKRQFDSGLCMEVIEHITPAMLTNLLLELAECASDGACFFFNTGLASFVKTHDPGYVDPIARGHIICWTVKAVSMLCEPFGLIARSLPGRDWAFLIEKGQVDVPIETRIFRPISENLSFLNDGRGPSQSLLSIAAGEAGRNYFNASEVESRSNCITKLREKFHF